MRFWAELVNEEKEFKNIPVPYPICAESLVKKAIVYIEYKKYLLRLEDEKEGLGDSEKRIYTDNCLEKKFDKFKEIARKHKEYLLTFYERNKEYKNKLKFKTLIPTQFKIKTPTIEISENL